MHCNLKFDSMRKTISILFFILLTLGGNPAYGRQFWRLDSLGGISWDVVTGDAHADHIEMGGKRVATVLRYGVRPDGSFYVNKSMVWPMLRTIPNDTHASLMRRYDWNPLAAVCINGKSMTGERVKQLRLDGVLSVSSEFDNGRYGKYELTRSYFPSTEQPALIERYSIKNTGSKKLCVEIPEVGFRHATDPAKGVSGAYTIIGKVLKPGVHYLAPGETVSFSASISAGDSSVEHCLYDAEQEEKARRELVRKLQGSLVLETPDSTINRLMDFAKLRGCESIYATKGGPLHGPGGESYYAAIWANDQAEYVNPFFPYVGYDYGNESARNSFRHFARFMNPEYRTIPSSIIAEGDDIWDGAGDRGDCAMIAYGAARYALARGDKSEAHELWPLIEWCLEYCRRKLNADGVVASDSDELEGRFPAGDANLCTSSLYYDALLSASYLAKELGVKGGERYLKEAKTLRRNINRYFGANVEGFDTYVYYKGNDVLRSWICIPLTVGIDERRDGTVAALFSPRLWTENGLLTQAGDKTFWDRSTLYALRGVFATGETEKGLEYLKRYSQTRLLGEHVPYPIEAWPEGSQRHLSAESGLYGRIITEGLFGIRPTGLRSFTMTPRLPREWDYMNLRHVRAFGADMDIEVRRLASGKLQVTVSDCGKIHRQVVPADKPIKIKL